MAFAMGGQAAEELTSKGRLHRRAERPRESYRPRPGDGVPVRHERRGGPHLARRDDPNAWMPGAMPKVSAHTSEPIDKEVRRLLDEAHVRAEKILTEHRELLNRLSALLIATEAIDGDELKAYFEGRKEVPNPATIRPTLKPQPRATATRRRPSRPPWPAPSPCLPRHRCPPPIRSSRLARGRGRGGGDVHPPVADRPEIPSVPEPVQEPVEVLLRPSRPVFGLGVEPHPVLVLRDRKFPPSSLGRRDPSPGTRTRCRRCGPPEFSSKSPRRAATLAGAPSGSPRSRRRRPRRLRRTAGGRGSRCRGPQRPTPASPSADSIGPNTSPIGSTEPSITSTVRPRVRLRPAFRAAPHPVPPRARRPRRCHPTPRVSSVTSATTYSTVGLLRWRGSRRSPVRCPRASPRRPMDADIHVRLVLENGGDVDRTTSDPRRRLFARGSSRYPPGSSTTVQPASAIIAQGVGFREFLGGARRGALLRQTDDVLRCVSHPCLRTKSKTAASAASACSEWYRCPHP